MKRMKWFALLLALTMILGGCGSANASGKDSSVLDSQVSENETKEEAGTISDSVEETNVEQKQKTEAADYEVVSEVEYKKTEQKEEWEEADCIQITFSEKGITAKAGANRKESEVSNLVHIDGSTVTIKGEGDYLLSGSASEANLIVDSTDDEPTRLVFSGLELTSDVTAPVFVANAKRTVITLAEGMTSTITDARKIENMTNSSEQSEQEELTAAIYSKDDLAFNGTGTLVVKADYKDGITSKDDLKIVNGVYQITAADDGIVGKDLLAMQNGDITITAQGDGMKSTNDGMDGDTGIRTKTEVGSIVLENGSVTITAGKDGIQAENGIWILDGTYQIQTAGGARESASEQISAKGLKGTYYVSLNGGTYKLDTLDDAIHSNGDITVKGGDYQIAAGDDGIHADMTLTILGGTIEITESYEGLEAQEIILEDGTIRLYASDDGLNAASASSSEGSDDRWGFGGKGGFGGGMDTDESCSLTINGGSLYVNARGDGLDSNGYLYMNGGNVVVEGPTDNGNGALDYGIDFMISGGTLLASGSAGMVQAPGTTSLQRSLAFISNQGNLEAGSEITWQTEDGTVLMNTTLTKTAQCVIFSVPELSENNTYVLLVDGVKRASVASVQTVTWFNESGETQYTGDFGGGRGGFGGGRGNKGNGDGTMRGEKPFMGDLPNDTMEPPAEGEIPEGMPEDRQNHSEDKNNHTI